MTADELFNDCSCCEGISYQTPVGIYNLPGLSSIKYRVGTHFKFKSSMLAGLSMAGLPDLRNLKTRDDDDFSIALIDAWATVADVLTFYQEYIANESYLRTAKERESVLNLARLIGYELRPGVAASAYLAFTIEGAQGSPGFADIDAGTKVQSIPDPGKLPQIFETMEKIKAKAEWNEIKPRLTRRHPVRKDMDVFYFEGTSTGLKPGDGLLISSEDPKEAPAFRQVKNVTPQPIEKRTLVELQKMPVMQSSIKLMNAAPIKSRINPVSDNNLFFSIGTVMDRHPGTKLPISARTAGAFSIVEKAANLSAFARRANFDTSFVFNNMIANRLPPAKVTAFKVRAAIFGHNAPSLDSLPSSQRFGSYGYVNDSDYDFIPGPYKDRTESSWVDTTLDNHHRQPNEIGDLFLDNVYSGIVKDSLVVLKEGSNWQHYLVENVSEITKSDFTLSAKITVLTIENRYITDNANNTIDSFKDFSIRRTTVYAQSDDLTLARFPISDNIARGNDTIELDGLVELLEGQNIIICGELSEDDKRGNRKCELAVISDVEHVLGEDVYTRIVLIAGLKNSYVRSSVTINANIALATNGEHKEEVLGGGDASESNQRFTLRNTPLTYIPAITPSGAESTLKVYVNDVEWHQTTTLFDRGPHDRIFIVKDSDDGNATIEFGDGKNGARLLTGRENVRAVYRKGLGVDGNLSSGKLNLLLTNPLGVRSVTNPIPSNGGDNAENINSARKNAPLFTLTMDRVVSLQDYEDFALAFAGIAKALATWTWNGRSRGVFITLSGPMNTDIPEDSPIYKNLLSALQNFGDPFVPLDVRSCRKAYFRLSANIKVDPDYQRDSVISAIRQAVITQFSFESRRLGQSVTLSEVIAVIQAVPGVVAVDMDSLYRIDDVSEVGSRADVLIAATPQVGGTDYFLEAAEILLLDPDRPFDSLGVMS